MYNYICLNCGKPFSSRTKNRKFCNRECTDIYKSKQALVTIKCDYCEKEFQRKKCQVKKDKNFCSIECRANSTKKRKIRYCSNCGKLIERKLSSFKAEGTVKERTDVYCSRECMSEHYHKVGKAAGEKMVVGLAAKICIKAKVGMVSKIKSEQEMIILVKCVVLLKKNMVNY